MNILTRINRKIKHSKYVKYLEKNSGSIYEKLLNLRINNNDIIDGRTDVEWIIFSKDRAIQLHAFISSYFEKVIHPAPLTILYKTSCAAHQKTYDELIQMFSYKPIRFIQETNFKPQLVDLLMSLSVSKIVFFCDDGVVTESFDMNDFAKFNPLVSVPSLLRGLDFTYCFAFKKDQALPKFLENVIPDNDKKVWLWKDCQDSPDWAYPLSVGGHLFSRIEMLLLLDFIDFKGPNSLEGNLQYFVNFFSTRYGICYYKTRLGSTPANIVNSEVLSNPTTDDLLVDELLLKWNEGMRIKYENYYGKDTNEIYRMKFEFINRNHSTNLLET